LFRNRTLATGMAWLGMTCASLFANNVFVLPTFTGSATANAFVYSGNPLTQVGTFVSSTDAFLVLSRPAAIETGTKYYIIGRGGSNTLIRLDRNLQPIGQPVSMGQNVTAAAVTPDGRRLMVIAGNLRMFNTETDAEIQTQFIDVGINPEDIAISHDSRRAFVLSTQAQRVTCVDLETNQVCGNLPLPGVTNGFLALGPNGFLYISAENNVLEADTRQTPFSTAAVRRQFPLQGARIGRLLFTPDGTRALAVNGSSQNGVLIYFFNLDLVASAVATVSTNEPALSGLAFEKLFVVGNSLAYAITTQTSARPRILYSIAIPDRPPVGSPLLAPTLVEAFFGSLGSVPIADSIAHTGEYPSASRMFLLAPLNLLTTAAANTLYNILFGGAQPNVINQLPFNFLPGPVSYAGPAVLRESDPPGGVVRYNSAQPPIPVGGRSLPIGIRVIGGSGRPLFNVPVVVTPTTPGATVEGPSTIFTNASGIAMATVTAPTTPGDFTIGFSVSNSGLSASFTLQAGPTSGGGGGGGGTGQGGGIIVLEGDGQAIPEGAFSRPIKLRIVDGNGQGIPGVAVTWTITQGGGRFSEGTSTDSADRLVTLTNAQGETENKIVAPGSIGLANSFQSSVASASTATSSVTLFFTTVLAFFNGFPAPPPSITFIQPTNEPRSIVGKAGQTIPNAIQLRVSASSGNQSGQVLPNIGIFPSTGNLPGAGPVVECIPKRVALTNEVGFASCDLKLSGRTGTGQIRVDVGGFSEQIINLRVEPGDPSNLAILNGNQQSGDINTLLPATLIVALDDGGGNLLPGFTINWEVIQGQATLTNVQTITDAQGRASNTVRLGTTPGPVQVRATATSGSRPSVTFDLRTNVTVTGIQIVSGNSQNTFTNTAFPQPLVVQVLDNRNLGSPGAQVLFNITTGSATLSTVTATTDANGRASVNVQAGATPGPIQVRATVTAVAGREVFFNLTSQLPGPQINALDVFNAASGERGAVVPGGIYRIEGRGIAPDLRGCVEGAPFLGMLPTRLATVEVQFGSFLAPLFSVCNESGRESVTVQVPFEMAPGGDVAITVRVGSGSSVVNGVQVVDLQPGAFETTDPQGRRFAVVLRPNGTFVTPENPARFREIVRAYITGVYQTTPAAVTGATGVAGQTIIAPIVVGLNDQGVRLVSATYAVGAVGIYEIAFEVTADTPTGPARPLGIIAVRPNGQFVFPFNSPTIAIAP